MEVDKISTRGFLGTKTNGIINGKYNHSDNYYDAVGIDVLQIYFNHGDIMLAGGDKEECYTADDKFGKGLFITDGLFCEYAYVYNEDDDTLEIYRGYFETPQWTSIGEKSQGKTFYTHLIMVIDRNMHTLQQVKKAMKKYESSEDKESMYPEHEVIGMCRGCFKPLKKGEEYCDKNCKTIEITRRV